LYWRSELWIFGCPGSTDGPCRKLKNDPQLKHIPVLMISASRENRQSALDAGADDFIE
jgi:CheY-like chemotaxis protein